MAAQEPVEIPAISLDERKLQQEGELRRAELALKEREVAAKEKELERSRWLNPTVLGLFAAAVGLIGNLIVASINNRGTLTIQHATAQSNLIVQAVSTGNYDTACKNIKSLITLHLLDDPRGILSRCDSVPSTIPVLPSQTEFKYTPPMDAPNVHEMHVVVSSKHLDGVIHLHVKFIVPSDTAIKKFDLITVYARRIDSRPADPDQIMPSIHGDWQPGQTAEFDTQVPESYTASQPTTLRFCVGNESDGCYPSTNLLLIPDKSKQAEDHP
jgi:hypothetical protein